MLGGYLENTFVATAQRSSNGGFLLGPDSRPAEPLAGLSGPLQARLDPRLDERALEGGDGTTDGEDQLPRWRRGIDVLLLDKYINAAFLKGFEIVL